MNETLALQHLFLSGVGRSGTTALRRSLGLHPQIFYNGKENNLVQDVVDVAHKNLTMQTRRNSLVVSEDDYLESFRKLIEEIVWPFGGGKNDRPISMAATNLEQQHMSTMCRMFPRAKFVCLIRNGLSVVSSRMRHKSFRESEFETHCNVWLRGAQMAAWAREQNESARVIRQEDFLVSKTVQETFGELFRWIGIHDCNDVAKNLLGNRYHALGDDASIEIKPAEYEQFDADRRREFEASRQDRWKAWTAPQREIFASICGDAMHEFDYEVPWM